MTEETSAVTVSAGPRCAPPKLYRIGEVEEYSHFSRQTIHNYTSMGLIREFRWTRGGHRLYDDSVFEKLSVIAQLKEQKKSLSFIKNYMSSMNRTMET